MIGFIPFFRQERSMTAPQISPLRQRMIEDMTIRQLGAKTQHHYVRVVRDFTVGSMINAGRVSKPAAIDA